MISFGWKQPSTESFVEIWDYAWKNLLHIYRESVLKNNLKIIPQAPRYPLPEENHVTRSLRRRNINNINCKKPIFFVVRWLLTRMKGVFYMYIVIIINKTCLSAVD